MFVYCADYVKKHSFLHRCAFLLHFKKVDYQVGKKEKHFFFLILISSPYFLALEKEKKIFFSKPPFPFKFIKSGIESMSLLEVFIMIKIPITATDHSFRNWRRARSIIWVTHNCIFVDKMYLKTLIKTRKERKLTNKYFQLHLDNFIKTWYHSNVLNLHAS